LQPIVAQCAVYDAGVATSGDKGRRLRYAPKLPVALIARLYRSDAAGIRDDALMEDVGWRLQARCRDVLLVSDSQVRCPECHHTVEVPWVGQSENRVASCAGCGWSITAGAYHESWRHQDLRGSNARAAFASFVDRFPRATAYAERMLLIDRLVHAVHTTGGLAARNLFEGRPRAVLRVLDDLAASSTV
jgi:ribosomal protein L37AE/L43A